MGGRATSSIGLIVGSIFMIMIGYTLTLDVYKDYGSYTINPIEEVALRPIYHYGDQSTSERWVDSAPH